MKSMVFPCCLAAAGLLLAIAAQVQCAPQSAPPQKSSASGSGGDKGVKKDAPPPAQGKVDPKADKELDPGDPKTSPRLTKLMTVRFDRRPSAILKAWSSIPEPPKTDEKLDPIDLELAALQRLVTLGEWDAVRSILKKWPEDEAKTGYKQLLQSLASGPPADQGPRPDGPPQMTQFMERNRFLADDIIGLAKATPFPLQKEHWIFLGRIVQHAVEGGTVVEHLVARLRDESAKPKGTAVLDLRQAANVLLAANQGSEIGVFLPSLDDALAKQDHEALNLLASHFLALHAKEKKGFRLEQAWSAAQAVLTAPTVDRAEKEEAVKRAVELAAKIREELGQTWLEESFSKEPQRGMEILATLGATTAQGIQRMPRDKDGRLKVLQLQKTAVEALLKAAPENAAKWQATLTLLAGNWLKEAEFSQQLDRSTGIGPRLRRDVYGNLYFIGDDDMPVPATGPQPNAPLPVTVANVLSCRPDDNWIAAIDPGLRPKLTMIYAQLYLKVGEEAKAFPFIEQLAVSHPDKARALVKEFLTVWARNHNPNANKDYTNPYMFMYGYERRAESIPLTRSKQERNLVDLAEWVVKLRGLELGDLDEELLAKAFTTCHSSAEVYRKEAIEQVFGRFEDLKPLTLAGLAQQMRANLSGLWRQPAVQADKKTNRKSKDIQVEVLRGYGVAQGVIDNGLKKFPKHWALTQAKAALWHDENSYRQELAKSTDFVPRRLEALNLFAQAARTYSDAVNTIAEEDENTQVFEQWFYTSLGACDLGQITEDMVPDMKQAALLRKALLELPGEAAERHMKKFANLLFTRLSAVKPAVKFSYLRAGLEIVGDHPIAAEARKVFAYYKDLVTEIKLHVAIDGSDVVGHQQPFGVFVNLNHTREIERESGGFSKYLQNQNTLYYAYNYGRPLADYRDRFQTAVAEALKEHFDVLSITFQTDKVNSRALPEYGWRFTPYAYLLLKARGPQVDKLPPLRIDLDFLDVSGYVIIPIESAAVPLDAAPKEPSQRPYEKLQITQTLDERQADKGKLILEVKAAAQGLVPNFDQILDLAPAGFKVEKSSDLGLSVARFDPDSQQNTIVSERTWIINLKASADQSSSPEKFQFAKPGVDGAEMTYQRYNDADLVLVQAEVPLVERYGQKSLAWLWWTLAGGAAGVLTSLALVVWLCKRKRRPKQGIALPAHLSPFTVIGLLKRLQRHNALSESEKKELQHSIGRLENHYFAQDGNGEVDLKSLAESWLQKAGNGVGEAAPSP